MYIRENLKERDQFENSRLKVKYNIKSVLKEWISLAQIGRRLEHF